MGKLEDLERKIAREKAKRESLQREIEAYEKITKGVSRRYSQTRVVSTEKVICHAKKGEIHNAILLIHEDGKITVKCKGECSDCEYGFLEPF